MSHDTIADLREILFDTLRKVKTGELDVDRAKAINDTAQVIINTAKVEIDHMRTIGSHAGSVFIEGAQDAGTTALPPPGKSHTETLANGSKKTITHHPSGAIITRHVAA